MADHIKIRNAGGTWVVRAGGAVLGETVAALEVSESGHEPVIYFPRDDIAMALLDRTDTTTRCAERGTASYFSIVTKSNVLKDAAWSYEDPEPGADAIRGYIAFAGSDAVAIERI